MSYHGTLLTCSDETYSYICVYDCDEWFEIYFSTEKSYYVSCKCWNDSTIKKFIDTGEYKIKGKYPIFKWNKQ